MIWRSAGICIAMGTLERPSSAQSRPTRDITPGRLLQSLRQFGCQKETGFKHTHGLPKGTDPSGFKKFQMRSYQHDVFGIVNCS
jgi:hypothetical protein